VAAGLISACGSVLLTAAGARVDWAVAAAPAPGELVSGDQHLVLARPSSVVLAVVDGLGRGPLAAEAAGEAVTALASSSEGPVSERARDCHEALRGTRGAVAAVVEIGAAGVMEWVSVGNVEAMVLRRRSGRVDVEGVLLAEAGILGAGAPRLRPAELRLRPGDLLLMVTDGVGAGFVRDLGWEAGPTAMVEHILASRSGQSDDDRLALAAGWNQY
jgi:hypothetical protein